MLSGFVSRREKALSSGHVGLNMRAWMLVVRMNVGCHVWIGRSVARWSQWAALESWFRVAVGSDSSEIAIDEKVGGQISSYGSCKSNSK